MSRSWIRVSVRVFSVFLLVAGLVAGVYVGMTRHAAENAERAGKDSPTERALDDMDRVSRDAGRAARGYKSRNDAAARAKKKAGAAGREAADRAADAEDAVKDEGSPSAPIGPIPESCKEYSGNKEIGCTLLLERGFELKEMPCLEKIWDHESGWNERASNPSSGAYGIPQALPGDKMAKYGDDWRTNPVPQIKWGLDYIKGRYNTPCGAWTFFQNNGWY